MLPLAIVHPSCPAGAADRHRREPLARVAAYYHVVFATAKETALPLNGEFAKQFYQIRPYPRANPSQIAAISPVRGWSKPQQPGVQRLAAECLDRGSQFRRAASPPWSEIPRHRRGRRRADGRYGPYGRGSGACGRSPAGRSRSAATSPKRFVQRVVRDARGGRRSGPPPASGGCWNRDSGERRRCRYGDSARPRQGRRIRARARPSRPWSANCAASAAMRRVVLGDDEQPGRVLVEAVHDAGPLTPPMPERLSPQWAISALTSVPVAVPGAGMHDQPGRLVDDDEVGVLVDDRRAGSSSACGSAVSGRRHGERDRLAGGDAAVRVGDRAARRRATWPVLDQRLQAAARKAARRGARGRRRAARPPRRARPGRRASLWVRPWRPTTTTTRRRSTRRRSACAASWCGCSSSPAAS